MALLQMDDATRAKYANGQMSVGMPMPSINFAQLQQQGQARPPSSYTNPKDNGFASFNGQPTGGGINNTGIPETWNRYGSGTQIQNEPDPNDWFKNTPRGQMGEAAWAAGQQARDNSPSARVPMYAQGGGLPSVADESRGVPSGRPPSTIPQNAPPPQTMRPAGPPGSGWGTTPGQMPQINGQPDLSGAYQHQYNNAGVPTFGGGPQSNFSPGSYKGPGNFDAYQPSNYYHPGNFQGPEVQPQGHFTAPQQGQQVDNRTMQSVLQALGNPSRYGSQQAGDTFDVLNHKITQAGNADYGRINEDMARRGIYASTTAGGRLGDLATNLNQQRSDMATNLATDQARQYQSDRSSAIAQALGFGGQQFNQGLEGFGANQQAGQQRFDQQLGRGQFGLQQQGQNFGEQMAQNAQNFGQQYQQYGANQQEAMNRYNAGYQNAQFGLNQNAQNYGQNANTYGLNLQGNAQGFGQQMAALGGLQNFGQAQFNNQLQQSQFNSDQDYRNTQMMLNMLGIQ